MSNPVGNTVSEANQTIVSDLCQVDEHLAAGYYELPEADRFRRWCRAYRRHFEHRPIDDVQHGERLAPSGPAADAYERILRRSYSFSWTYHPDLIAEVRADPAASPTLDSTLSILREEFDEQIERLGVITTPHTVGGRGYTHSIPNYGRVIQVGLDGYAERISRASAADRRAGATHEEEEAAAAVQAGLLDLIDGIRAWHTALKATLASDPTPDAALLDALERVPFSPAGSFYEALVCYNFVYYLDGCDNPGRFDQELIDYYRRDLEADVIDEAEALELIGEFFANVDANNGWSTGIGGNGPNGADGYNELTVLCLRAATGRRRPNLQLHVTEEMPEEVWNAAFDSLSSGSGLPALYDDGRFTRALEAADLGIAPEDLPWRNGGGCTETMIHGRSNVGSLDAGINLPLILTELLESVVDSGEEINEFEDLISRYEAAVRSAVEEVTGQVNAYQAIRAQLRPQPVRSLLIDDCIERALDFNAGGARYNWSVVNVAGLANVADSLEALRVEVFENEASDLATVVEALRSDFRGFEAVRSRLSAYPKFGNDVASVDAIARRAATCVFNALLAQPCWRGGRFLGSCLMFVTYAMAGEPVGATPDGRGAGTPIADSAGAAQGRDTHGPTAMIKSVASLPHHAAPGTLVVNARFSAELFRTPEGRDRLRSLILSYFDLGGMQLQINVVDQEVLRDAIEHPERHSDLIVRVGGYSEYFNRLSDALKHTVLERVEHGA